MRRVHLAWPSWQYGSVDPAHLGERPGWLDGRRMNGVGLTQSSQVVVEFDAGIQSLGRFLQSLHALTRTVAVQVSIIAKVGDNGVITHSTVFG